MRSASVPVKHTANGELSQLSSGIAPNKQTKPCLAWCAFPATLHLIPKFILALKAPGRCQETCWCKTPMACSGLLKETNYYPCLGLPQMQSTSQYGGEGQSGCETKQKKLGDFAARTQAGHSQSFALKGEEGTAGVPSHHGPSVGERDGYRAQSTGPPKRE